jgi:hypothetical protein
MRALILVILSITIASLAWAQADRRAIGYYEANFEKYLGREISVDVASSEREDTGELSDVAVFRIYTKGKTEAGFAYAVVPKSDVAKFSRRYAEKDDYRATTSLRGVFTKRGSYFYISVDGAVLPDEKAEAAPDPE